jgi:ABC-type transporter Mla subunit MlaD
MILILLLFSVITEILKAECDLTNKQVAARLERDDEVCLIENVKNNLNSLFEWSDRVAINLDELLGDGTNGIVDTLAGRINDLIRNITTLFDWIQVLKTDQDKLFEWSDEITASVNDLKKSWKEQTEINDYFFSEINDLVSDPDSDSDSDPDSDSDD